VVTAPNINHNRRKMKNTFNKCIASLAVPMFIMMAPMTQGMGPIVPGTDTDRMEIMPSTTVSQNQILLAENKENTAGDNAQGAPGANDPVSEPESSPDTDPKDPSAKSKPAPLKPFNPSEEIAAEQAVDFPVDI
jgi:hypothetical protein